MPTRRLIVNADDFGRTAGVNRGVLEAHDAGIVTSATLMVNHPAAEQAAKSARSRPRLGLGLHLALTGGPASLPQERVPSLVDERGRLPAKPDGLSAADPEEVAAEAWAQLERFRALVGANPSHLDSHHHAHRLPVVLDAVVALAREIGLPVRRASEEVGERLRSAGIRTTEAFVESFYGEGVRLEGLLDTLRALPSGTSELMCHPAVVDEELSAGSGYAEPRGRELALLTRAEVRSALAREAIVLIHYGEL